MLVIEIFISHCVKHMESNITIDVFFHYILCDEDVLI